MFSNDKEIKKLEVTVDNIVYQTDSHEFKVVRVTTSDKAEKKFTAVGEMPELYEGQDLELEGKWVRHEKYGRQFQVNKCVVNQPTTEKGVKKFLASGLIEGVGEKYANRIVDKFGEDTLEVIEQQPKALLEVSGIGEKRLEKITESWEDQKEIREVMIALKSYDISTAYSLRIYRGYGARAPSIVKDDPYRLTHEIDGIGFKIADRIAAKVGIDHDDPERAKAGLRYTLRQSSSNGHVYLPRRILVDRAQEILGTDKGLIVEALEKMLEDGYLISSDELQANSRTPVYLPSLYFAEVEVADSLSSLDSTGRWEVGLDPGGVDNLIDSYQISSGFDYSGEQREAVRTALTNRVTVITGGPGTGKTTIITGIIAIMDKLGWEVTLAAPTGRAAKRLSEMTGENAKTIHRTLGYSPPGTFEHDEENQLDTDAIIVDELSMVDLRLLNHLLRAVPDGSRLVLVGDADQLPSVGPGDVINDIIKSNRVKTVNLTRIYRQSEASEIVENAHRINNGDYPAIRNRDDGDFFFFREDDPDAARRKIIELVSREIPGRWDLDPLDDLQVLSPMYKGVCGVDRLNEDLQKRLNDEGYGGEGIGDFYVGDKVMQTENDYEKLVFNGDIGRIVSLDKSNKELEVRYPDYGVINYKKGDIDSLDLAYAVTIHKSQGSEYEGVILPVLNQHFVMLKRNLLYTAVTRSKKLVMLVGSQKAIGIAVNNDEENRRFTALTERLRRSYEGLEKGLS
ncbi:ATP-dependent RecD-like DNA helicase [Candidatus Bipolaricaulota bacterium]|nr:ATP-dependent RecD-like DNA helicase [Candidatus Bipolaricaulota bacterium]